jgi:hypothetical protein
MCDALARRLTIEPLRFRGRGAGQGCGRTRSFDLALLGVGPETQDHRTDKDTFEQDQARRAECTVRIPKLGPRSGSTPYSQRPEVQSAHRRAHSCADAHGASSGLTSSSLWSALRLESGWPKQYK